MKVIVKKNTDFVEIKSDGEQMLNLMNTVISMTGFLYFLLLVINRLRFSEDRTCRILYLP